ncbi:hypothetical protein LTR85_001414 [Meristemomyces frigidus]|nr:hypothetical protein LTR85_001414 [Meristemomyces frigidus]
MADHGPAVNKKRGAEEDDGPKRRVRRKASEAPKIIASVVTVSVGGGKDMKTFIVNEDLLKTHSDFFEAAFRGVWKEAKSRSVAFKDESPEVFEIFYHFVHTGQIFSSKDNDFTHDKNGETTSKDLEWGRLCGSWLLGNKLLSTSFKDAVVDALTSKMAQEERWPLSMYTKVYPGSCASSQIRRLLVDVVVWTWTIGIISKGLEIKGFPDFLFDVAIALDQTKVNGRQGKAPFESESCQYHEHVAEGKACYRTMF